MYDISLIKEQIKNIPKINFAKDKLVSYSQYSLNKDCSHRWKLIYVDKVKIPSFSINTIFGTAIHNTIQKWLDVLYNISSIEADNMNLNDIFQDFFAEEYKKTYEKNNNTHFSDSEEMNEFFEDGIAILEFIQRNRTTYFNKKGWSFIGYEVPISLYPHEDYSNVIFQGYIDLVFYNEHTNKFYLYDLKTSTRSWTDGQKKDETKQNQLRLYKKYFSKQFKVNEEDIFVEFIILKRKITEHYFDKRIQSVIPSQDKSKTEQADKEIQNFILENFEKDGKFKKDKNYIKSPSPNVCKWCQFSDKPQYCDKKK